MLVAFPVHAAKVSLFSNPCTLCRRLYFLPFHTLKPTRRVWLTLTDSSRHPIGQLRNPTIIFWPSRILDPWAPSVYSTGQKPKLSHQFSSIKDNVFGTCARPWHVRFVLIATWNLSLTMAMQWRQAPHWNQAISNAEHFFVTSTLHGAQSCELQSTVFPSLWLQHNHTSLSGFSSLHTEQTKVVFPFLHTREGRRMKYPPHALSSFLVGVRCAKHPALGSPLCRSKRVGLLLSCPSWCSPAPFRLTP